MVNSRTTRPDGPQDQLTNTCTKSQSPRSVLGQAPHTRLCLWAARRHPGAAQSCGGGPTSGQGNLTVQPHMLCCAPGRHGTVTTAALSGGCQARVRPPASCSKHGGGHRRSDRGIWGWGAEVHSQGRPGQPCKRLGLGLIEQQGWVLQKRMAGAFQQRTGEFIPCARVWGEQADRRGLQRI